MDEFEELKDSVRTVPDYPAQGVQFRDITTLLQNANHFKKMVDGMTKQWAETPVDAILSIESRGFIMAGAIAYFLDAAKNIKASVSIPIMVTGGFRSISVMEDALTSSSTDLIGIGRPFVIDPSFPYKLLNGDISVLPAVERNFPPAQDIPKGAVLNLSLIHISEPTRPY